MNKIGFKLSGTPEISEKEWETFVKRRDQSAQQILQQEAMQLLYKLVAGYCGADYPFVKGEARSKMFMEKLELIRLRYFEKIEI